MTVLSSQNWQHSESEVRMRFHKACVVASIAALTMFAMVFPCHGDNQDECTYVGKTDPPDLRATIGANAQPEHFVCHSDVDHVNGLNVFFHMIKNTHSEGKVLTARWQRPGIEVYDLPSGKCGLNSYSTSMKWEENPKCAVTFGQGLQHDGTAPAYESIPTTGKATRPGTILESRIVTTFGTTATKVDLHFTSFVKENKARYTVVNRGSIANPDISSDFC
jgi:hypothetical protein